MVTDSHREYLDRFIAAWNSHDVDAIGELYAEDAIMEDSGLFEGHLEGREEIQSYYRKQWAQTPKAYQKVRATGANEDQLFVHFEWFPGDEFTGLTMQGVSIWTLEDGVMKTDITYFNPTQMRAEGLHPAFVD